jgi:hypothetical protein
LLFFQPESRVTTRGNFNERGIIKKVAVCISLQERWKLSLNYFSFCFNFSLKSISSQVAGQENFELIITSGQWIKASWEDVNTTQENIKNQLSVTL